jgi:uncharacterized protein (DUF1684 family)
MAKSLKLLVGLLIISFFSCSFEKYDETGDIKYLNNINDWQKRRIENLRKENGWLNLVGLYWLNEGENTFGSENSNDIIFPNGKADKFLGKLVKKDSIITTYIYEGMKVFHNDTLIEKIEMMSDMTGNPTILSHGTLKWFVIKRGDRWGIRLRDLEADLLSSFEGIERFAVQDKWKIKAQFVEYNPPKKIFIPSIIGAMNESYSPGALIFTIDNKEYQFEPIKSGDRLFIVFADLTSGEETYGAGRFLYTDGPDSNNNVILDFNKAYNSPCAFTMYATCPLPP